MKKSNTHKWDTWYKNLTAPMFYGKSVTYDLGHEFLKDCKTVEDWGTGGGGFKTYRPDAIGVDGSNTPFADKKFIDLTKYVSECDGIFMRHVLEHNYEWAAILRNALQSAKKVCVVMFIPFNDVTVERKFNKIGVPDLAINRDMFFEILKQHNASYTEEVLATRTEYRYENVIRITL